MREIKDNELRKKFINMGKNLQLNLLLVVQYFGIFFFAIVTTRYALTEASFNYYGGEIRRANKDAIRWIGNIPREKWARAYDGGQRWGHMKTNLAESLNSVLKVTRNLPITALVKATYFRMGSLFGKLGHQWTQLLASGQTHTASCLKGLAQEVIEANSHNVMQVDRESFYFMVAERINWRDGRPLGTFSVDLRKRVCDCGKFQAFHLPCSHAIAACASIRQDYTMYIPEVFTILNVVKVYQ